MEAVLLCDKDSVLLTDPHGDRAGQLWLSCEESDVKPVGNPEGGDLLLSCLAAIGECVGQPGRWSAFVTRGRKLWLLCLEDCQRRNRNRHEERASEKTQHDGPIRGRQGGECATEIDGIGR